MWSVRGNPNIKKVFSRIWNSNELCVSFDGAGCFRDWHLNIKWKTAGNWYHCDQVNHFSIDINIHMYDLLLFLRIHFENLIDVPYKVLFL